MQNLTNEITRPFRPEAVLVAYKRVEGSDYYLESRMVDENGVVGAGKPVSRELMQAIARNFSATSDRLPKGLMPKNLLYADPTPGNGIYVWWNGPKVRTLTFTPQVPMQDGDFHMPGVVYVVKGRTLSVYAFDGKRPTDKTSLVMGPFFNYYQDCKVCLGSSRMDFPQELTWESLLLTWENIFWNSTNAHLIAHPVTGNIITHLENAKDKPFDISVCVKLKLTLADLLRRLK